MKPRTAYFVVWRLGDVGGMERHFCDLAIALKRRGTGVTVFVEQPLAADNRYARALQGEGIAMIIPSRMTRIAMRFEHRWLYRRATSWRRESPATFALLGALKRKSRNELPDVVHVHGCHLAQRAVLEWAKLRGIPAAYTEHITIADWTGSDEMGAPGGFEDADAAIACVSERSRESLATIIRSPISLATHIVPDVAPRAFPAPAEEALRLLCVGRLESCKGIHILLLAAAILRDWGLPFTLVIAGDGAERGALEELRSDLRLEREVMFAGLVDQETIPALWAKVDLGVLPSITEGLPISVVEAQAAGRPMIATDVGGTPEVLTDGVEGFLVPADDPAALASAIARCMDRSLLASMARAARSRFECGPWSTSHAVNQAEALYDLAKTSRLAASTTFLDRYRSECFAAEPPPRVALQTYRVAAYGVMEQRFTRQALALSKLGIDVTLHVANPVPSFNRYRRALRQARVRVSAPTMVAWLGRRLWTRITRGADGITDEFYPIVTGHQAGAIHVHGWQFRMGRPLPGHAAAATTSNVRTIYEEHDAFYAPAPLRPPDFLSFDALIAPSIAAADQIATSFGGDHPRISVIDAMGETKVAPAFDAARSGTIKIFALVEATIRAELAAALNLVFVDELDCADLVVLTPTVTGYATTLNSAMASFKPVILTCRDSTGPIRHRINGLIARDLAEEIEFLVNDPLMAHQLVVAARRTHELDGHDSLAIAAQLVALYRPYSRVMSDARG